MKQSYAVIIVGAGIMGLSTAYYLARKGYRDILVLEKEESWITGSTARANGGFRQQFSTSSSIRLSQLSLPVLENFEAEFDVDIAFRQFETAVLLNAAGPYARELGRMAGTEVPIDPVRRMLILTEDFPQIPDRVPMTIDLDTGFFMRKESGRVLMGWSDPEEPVGYNCSFDPGYIEAVAEKAVIRVPALSEAAVNPRRCWAGLYEVSPDHHSILGESHEIEGFFLANGFSGHGMMHSPAVGMVLADLILEKETELIDVHPLRPGRFRDGELLDEGMIV